MDSNSSLIRGRRKQGRARILIRGRRKERRKEGRKEDILDSCLVILVIEAFDEGGDRRCERAVEGGT